MGLMNHLLNAATTAHARRYHGKVRDGNDFVNDATLDGLTLSRSAGSVYYFNGSGVLVPTGDNVAAFTSNGLFIEGQATNLIPAANYRNISTWTATGASMKATTPTGIDGTTLTVSQNEILEDTGTTEHRYALAWTAATAAKQSAMVAVKRGTGTRHAQLRIGNATDGIYGAVAINLDTLAEIGTGTWEYFTAYVKGAYTIIELVDTNTTTGAQTIYVNLHNGTSNSYTGDGTSTLVVDWAQVVTSGFSQSHIQGAATRYPSYLSRPWIGSVNNYWFYVDFNVLASYNLFPSTLFYSIATVYKSASDYINVVTSTNTGKIRITRRVAGVNTNTETGVIPFVRGDRLRLLVTQDSTNGVRIRVNHSNTAYTAQQSSGTGNLSVLSNGAVFYLANFDGATDRVIPSEARSYKIGTGSLTSAQMTEMVGV